MQAVSDQTACALQKLLVFIAERVQLIALDVHHSKNVPMVIPHRDNSFRARRVKRRQISRIFVHIPDNDGLARIQRRAAQPLGDGKARISWRFVPRFRDNDELVFHDLINADPPITAGGANHFHDLPHSFSRAPASQRKRADFLQLLASGFLHSRESNLAQNKPSASTISTFYG